LTNIGVATALSVNIIPPCNLVVSRDQVKLTIFFKYFTFVTMVLRTAEMTGRPCISLLWYRQALLPNVASMVFLAGIEMGLTCISRFLRFFVLGLRQARRKRRLVLIKNRVL
jgi:hypothetical protein